MISGNSLSRQPLIYALCLTRIPRQNTFCDLHYSKYLRCVPGSNFHTIDFIFPESCLYNVITWGVILMVTFELRLCSLII